MAADYIAYIREQMNEDDEDTKDQSERLESLYNLCNKAQRQAIDDALICVCGWTFKNIKLNSGR
jgi:hypothetical protein